MGRMGSQVGFDFLCVFQCCIGRDGDLIGEWVLREGLLEARWVQLFYTSWE